MRPKYATIGDQLPFTGHKTESIYRRYTIVAEPDLRDAGAKLSALDGAQESHRAR